MEQIFGSDTKEERVAATEGCRSALANKEHHLDGIRVYQSGTVFSHSLAASFLTILFRLLPNSP